MPPKTEPPKKILPGPIEAYKQPLPGPTQTLRAALGLDDKAQSSMSVLTPAPEPTSTFSSSLSPSDPLRSGSSLSPSSASLTPELFSAASSSSTDLPISTSSSSVSISPQPQCEDEDSTSEDSESESGSSSDSSIEDTADQSSAERIAELEAALSAAAEETAAARNKADLLELENAGLRAQLEGYVVDLADQEQSRVKAEENLEQARRKHLDLETSVAQKDAALKDVGSKIITLEERIEQSQKQLEQERQQLVRERQEALETITQATTEARSVQAAKAQQDSELINAIEEADRAKAALSTAQMTKDALSNALRAAEKACMALKKNRDKEQANVKKHWGDLFKKKSAIEAELDGLLKQKQDLLRSQDALTKEKHSLLASRDSMREEVSALERKIRDRENTIHDLKNSLGAAREKVKKAEESNIHRIATLVEEIYGLKRELSAAQKKETAAWNKAGFYSREAKRLEEIRKRHESEEASKRDLILKQQKEIEALKAQLSKSSESTNDAPHTEPVPRDESPLIEHFTSSTPVPPTAKVTHKHKHHKHKHKKLGKAEEWVPVSTSGEVSASAEPPLQGDDAKISASSSSSSSASVDKALPSSSTLTQTTPLKVDTVSLLASLHDSSNLAVLAQFCQQAQLPDIFTLVLGPQAKEGCREITSPILYAVQHSLVIPLVKFIEKVSASSNPLVRRLLDEILEILNPDLVKKLRANAKPLAYVPEEEISSCGLGNIISTEVVYGGDCKQPLLWELNKAADVYFKNGKYYRALYFYTQAFKLYSTKHTTLLNIAFCFNAICEFKISLEILDGVLGAQPDKAAEIAKHKASVVNGWGQKEFANGKWENAREKFEEAVNICPDDAKNQKAMYWTNLGIALKELHRFDDAMKAVDQALALDKDRLETHQLCAELFALCPLAGEPKHKVLLTASSVSNSATASPLLDKFALQLESQGPSLAEQSSSGSDPRAGNALTIYLHGATWLTNKNPLFIKVRPPVVVIEGENGPLFFAILQDKPFLDLHRDAMTLFLPVKIGERMINPLTLAAHKCKQIFYELIKNFITPTEEYWQCLKVNPEALHCLESLRNKPCDSIQLNQTPLPGEDLSKAGFYYFHKEDQNAAIQCFWHAFQRGRDPRDGLRAFLLMSPHAADDFELLNSIQDSRVEHFKISLCVISLLELALSYNHDQDLMQRVHRAILCTGEAPEKFQLDSREIISNPLNGKTKIEIESALRSTGLSEADIQAISAVQPDQLMSKAMLPLRLCNALLDKILRAELFHEKHPVKIAAGLSDQSGILAALEEQLGYKLTVVHLVVMGIEPLLTPLPSERMIKDCLPRLSKFLGRERIMFLNKSGLEVVCYFAPDNEALSKVVLCNEEGHYVTPSLTLFSETVLEGLDAIFPHMKASLIAQGALSESSSSSSSSSASSSSSSLTDTKTITIAHCQIQFDKIREESLLDKASTVCGKELGNVLRAIMANPDGAKIICAEVYKKGLEEFLQSFKGMCQKVLDSAEHEAAQCTEKVNLGDESIAIAKEVSQSFFSTIINEVMNFDPRSFVQQELLKLEELLTEGIRNVWLSDFSRLQLRSWLIDARGSFFSNLVPPFKKPDDGPGDDGGGGFDGDGKGYGNDGSVPLAGGECNGTVWDNDYK